MLSDGGAEDRGDEGELLALPTADGTRPERERGRGSQEKEVALLEKRLKILEYERRELGQAREGKGKRGVSTLSATQMAQKLLTLEDKVR